MIDGGAVILIQFHLQLCHVRGIHARVGESDGLGLLLADGGTGAGGGNGGGQDLLFALQHSLFIEADLIFVQRTADSELHLIVLRPSIVIFQPYVAVFGGALCHSGVAQRGRLGGSLADIGGAGTGGGLGGVGILIHGADDTAAGIDLILVLGAVGPELHLVDLNAVFPVQLDLQAQGGGLLDSGVRQSDGLGLALRDKSGARRCKALALLSNIGGPL